MAGRGARRHHHHRHPGDLVADARRASERTLRLLVPADGVPRVDAVVFLLRTLNAADIALLKQIGQLVGGSVGGARHHRGRVTGRRDRRRPHRRDAVGEGRGHPVHQRDGPDRHLPGGGAGVRAAGADRTHAASERVHRAAEAGRLRRRRAQQGHAERGPLRPGGQPAAGGRRHPRAAAGPVRHVRDPDLDRACCAAGVTDSVGLADELLERSGLVALREVIDQQFAQRSDMLKAHTALVSLRRFVEAYPDLGDALHHRRHRPAAGRHPRLRGTPAAQSIAFAANDIE